MKRKLFLGLWLLFLFIAIATLFWKNEYKYSQPTPIPKNYRTVDIGTHIDFGKRFLKKNKPIFIHFFNPECPCSRFNVPHVRGLIKKYSDKIDFRIVVLNKEKDYTVTEIQDKFDAPVPVFFDENISKKCGVYSTPQAVLIDGSQNLYYRGNYNKNRYCTDDNSNYAQMAIDSLLSRNITPSFDGLALKAYGCSLPKCAK